MKITPKGTKTKNTILFYGIELLEEFGLHGVTFTALNNRFNISSQHVTYYFGSVENFRNQVAELAVDCAGLQPVAVAHLILCGHPATHRLSAETKKFIFESALFLVEMEPVPTL